MNLFNNLQSLRPKKTYLVSKLSDEDQLFQIKNCFEEPEKYLKMHPKMIVGKIIKGPRLDDEQKIIPYSVVGPSHLFEDSKYANRHNSLKYSTKSSHILLPTNNFNRKTIEDKNQKKINFESIDENKLKSIYSSFNNLKVLNENKINEFMKRLPGEVNKLLNSQQKILVEKNSLDNKDRQMSKYLSRRVKKTEDELLINNIDSYRIKKEIGDFIENKKSYDEKYGSYNWMISLRRAKNFNGNRVAYVNYGDNNNPTWLGIRETSSKQTELVRKPNSFGKKEYKKLKNNRYLLDQTENLINFNDLENLSDLEVNIFI